MEESKELQGLYTIFRATIYISLLLEFFMYALDPTSLDFLGGLITTIYTHAYYYCQCISSCHTAKWLRLCWSSSPVSVPKTKSN